ncbi:Os05g0433600 [Oryza sativa Japonica Group]|uniref:Os05g0433600 protein n=1 Tax=Oryza sativa subsp. japonica TaxID=39947 RepID=A0A0P0WMU5_ORYSJ|nr:hypothetical protein EE612_029700 [Oryza sativa]BAS94180.1 Os05g0433600 [Oryza sativa Japonica Group]
MVKIEAPAAAGLEEPAAVLAIKMDKTTIIVSAVVGSLGLLSAILGFAAEGAKRTKATLRTRPVRLVLLVELIVSSGRAGCLRGHLAGDNTGHRGCHRRLLRVLQVPRHPVRDQADRRRRLRRLLLVSRRAPRAYVHALIDRLRAVL